MHHIFFIRSSLDGRLSCFHVLATVHSAAVNFGMHVSCRSYFSLDICPGVGLQGYIVALFLVFIGTSILFSMVALPMYIPINSVGGFPFLHTLSSIYYL